MAVLKPGVYRGGVAGSNVVNPESQPREFTVTTDISILSLTMTANL